MLFNKIPYNIIHNYAKPYHTTQFLVASYYTIQNNAYLGSSCHQGGQPRCRVDMVYTQMLINDQMHHVIESLVQLSLSRSMPGLFDSLYSIVCMYGLMEIWQIYRIYDVLGANILLVRNIACHTYIHTCTHLFHIVN